MRSSHALPTIALFFLLMLFTGCPSPSDSSGNGNTPDVKVTSVTLNKSSLTIQAVGGTEQLFASVYPSDAAVKTVSWTSSNTGIANVSAEGIVSAVSLGSATITATTTDGSKTAACTVKVGISVASITPNKLTTYLAVGGTSEQLFNTVLPDNADNKNVAWTTSSAAIATVTAEGIVTGKAAGTATITATTVDGGYKADCTVTISVTPIAVDSLSVSPVTRSVKIGSYFTLSTTILPNNATNRNISWSSSNEAIATVTIAGVVTGVTSGTATITATSADDSSKTATCAVIVPVPPASVSLDMTAATLFIGSTQQLAATVFPADATDKRVTWTSSSTYYATVTSTGLVTANAAGSATITATTVDGAKTATCTVTGISTSTGTIINVLPAPTLSKLFVNPGSTIRLAIGLGMSLPYNTWTPWEITATSALWFPVIAEAGKTYTVNWDDFWNGTTLYTADLSVGAYLANQTTRVTGWSGDIDAGYPVGQSFSVTSTQLVYIKVIPFASQLGSIGTFALKISESGTTNTDQSFVWYADGTPIAGQSDYVYFLDPASAAFTAGKHRITIVASRGGASFSETYTFSK